MSETAYRAPAAPDRFPAPAGGDERRSRSWAARHVWWIVAVALVGFSAALVRWAYTRPGYDPYGWLVWGYQTLHGTLNLGGAPSWKPMPWLFTVPYALFGHFDLWLWMTTAVAMALAGVIFAGRIVFRIVDGGGRHRWPAILAAVLAGIMILSIQDNQGYSYWHYFLSAQSDPPLASLCLVLRGAHPRRARPARGVAVHAHLPALGLAGARAPEHDAVDHRRGGAGAAAVVRGPDDHQRPAVHLRSAGAALAADAARLGDPRHDRALQVPEPLAGVGAGWHRRGVGGLPPPPRRADAVRRRAAVDGGRGVLLAAGLPGPAAVHVRAGAGLDRDRGGSVRMAFDRDPTGALCSAVDRDRRRGRPVRRLRARRVGARAQ